MFKRIIALLLCLSLMSNTIVQAELLENNTQGGGISSLDDDISYIKEGLESEMNSNLQQLSTPDTEQTGEETLVKPLFVSPLNAGDISEATTVSDFTTPIPIYHEDDSIYEWYSFSLSAGEGVSVSVAKTDWIESEYFTLEILSSDGNVLQSNSGGYGNEMAYIGITAQKNGLYYARISGNAGTYSLSVNKAWFVPDVQDSDRVVQFDLNSAKYISDGQKFKDSPSHFYRFYAASGDDISVNITPHTSGSMGISLYDVYGQQIIYKNWISDFQTDGFTHVIAETGLYYIEIFGEYCEYELDFTGILPDADTDNDGLFDTQEYYHKTNPLLTDTDNDGVDDKSEILNGTNPTIRYELNVDDVSDATARARAIDLPVLNTFFAAESINENNSTYYKITLEKDEGITIAFKSMDNSYKYVYLLQSNGTELKSIYSSGEISALDYTVTATGTYYLQVDGPAGKYQLGLYEAWFNSGITDLSRDYFETPYTSKQINIGETHSDAKEYNTDVYYRFDLLSGEGFDIQIDPIMNVGSIRLTLCNQYMDEIESSEGETNRATHLNRRIWDSGTYYIKVSGTNAVYNLTINKAWYNPGVSDIDRTTFETTETAGYIKDGLFEKGQNSHFYRFIASKGDVININLSSYSENYIGFNLLDSDKNYIDGHYYIDYNSTGNIDRTIAENGVYYFEITGGSGEYYLDYMNIGADKDTDADGLSDSQEYFCGTNPSLTDTDNDGVSDFDELSSGTNPLISTELSLSDVANATARTKAVELPVINSFFEAEKAKDTQTFYKITLAKDEGITIALKSHSRGYYDGITVRLLSSTGSEITSVYSYSEQAEILDYTATSTGTYYLQIDGFYGKYNLGVFKAWFNSNVTDADRSFYGSIYTAKEFVNGQNIYGSKKLNEAVWYRINVANGDGITMSLAPACNIGLMSLELFDSANNLLTGINVESNNVGWISETVVNAGVYYIKVSGARGEYCLYTGASWFNPGAVDSDIATNSTYSTAKYIEEGIYQKDNNSKYFRFIANAGNNITIALDTDSDDYNYMVLSDSDYNDIKSDSGYNGIRNIDHTFAYDGLYYLRVEGAGSEFELSYIGINPDADTDGDGLWDSQEYYHGTDINNIDTDNDGISDYDELAGGTNPLISVELSANDIKNATDRARALSVPIKNAFFAGVKGDSGQTTFFKFTLAAGEGISAVFKAEGNSNYYNYRLNLLSSTGTPIKGIYSYGGHEYIEYVAEKTGTYYLQVEGDSCRYQIGLFDAWFNAEITDDSRSYYSSPFTSKVIDKGDIVNDLKKYGIDIYYRLELLSGEGIDIELAPTLNVGSIYLELLDTALNPIGSVNADSGRTAHISREIFASGTYYIKVSGVAGKYIITANKAWFNPGTVDSDRNYNTSFNSAKYLTAGEYEKTDENQYFRFLAQQGDEININLTYFNNPIDFNLRNVKQEYVDGVTYGGFNKTRTLDYVIDETGVYFLEINGYVGGYELSFTGVGADRDTDGDGIWDTQECYHGTKIYAVDTDGDGISDYDELITGTNPIIHNNNYLTGTALTEAVDFETALDVPSIGSNFSVNRNTNEQNFYKFSLSAGETIKVYFKARSNLGYMNLNLYNPENNWVQGASSNNNSTELEYAADQTGMHYLSVDGSVGEYTIKISIMNSAKIEYSLNKSYVVTDGEDNLIQPDNLYNYQYSLYNKTKDIWLSQLDVRSSYIFLTGQNVSVGDELELSISGGDIVPQKVNLTLDSEKTAKAEITLIQKGRISAVYNSALNDDKPINTLLYDAQGKLINTYNYSYEQNQYMSDSLDNGDYTVIFIKGNQQLWRLSDIAEYGKMGLEEETHYIMHDVTVYQGILTHIDNITVPSFDEALFSYFDRSATMYTANTDTVLPNGLIALRVQYKLKPQYANEITNANIQINIPSGSTFIGNSLTIDGVKTTNFVESDTSLTIPVTKDSGVILFNIRPTEVTQIFEEAFMYFYYDNNYITENIGSVNLGASFVTLVGSEVTNTSKNKYSGIAPANSTVRLYDGNVAIGSAIASSNGKWSMTATLDNVYYGSVHSLTAKVLIGSGEEKISNVLTVSYNPENTKVIEAIMVHNNQRYVISQDLVTGAKPIVTFGPGMPFTFTVKFSDNTLIDEVFIKSIRNNETKQLKATFDSKQGLWIATGFFDPADPNYVPGSLSIGYTIKSQPYVADVKYSFTAEGAKEIPSEWRNSKVVVEEQTENKVVSNITLDNENHDQVRVVQEKTPIPTQDVGKSEDYYKSQGFTRITLSDGSTAYVKNEYKTNSETDEEGILTTVYNIATKTAEKIFVSYGRKILLGSTGSKILGTAMDIISWGGRTIRVSDARNIIQNSNLSVEERARLNSELDRLQLASNAYTISKFALTAIGIALAPTGIGAFVFVAGVALYGSLFDYFWNKGMNRLEAEINGFSFRWAIDPSGYVYEAVTTNRLKGVKTTAYFKENESDEPIIWDALEFEQFNPLYTDGDGRYAWDVPEGLWQVQYELEGYETTYSDWLPVPPPQTEVNIGMVSKATPEIKWFNVHDTYAEIEFTKYMQPETVTGLILKSGDTDIPYTLSYSQDEQSPDGKVYAKRYKLIYDDYTASAGNYSITTDATVLSYADVPTKSEEKTVAFELPASILATEKIVLNYGATTSVIATITNYDPLNPVAITALSDFDAVMQVIGVSEIDIDGKFTIEISGNLPGEANLIISIPDKGIETVVPILITVNNFGNVNDDSSVDAADVITLKRYLAGWEIPSFKAENADVNADGKVNDIDVVILKRYLAGWNVVLG